MKAQFLDILRCPESGTELFFVPNETGLCHSDDGYLETKDKKRRYPVISGIPRFVSNSNYAENFGVQWKKFSNTQLDSFSGQPISSNRFWGATGWDAKDLRGKWVLDVGCGAGRFAEVALKAGAIVVALDYSSAVDSCKANFIDSDNFFAVQGDVYSLPFGEEAFDFVYSLGVLQHTPDVKRAFLSLPPIIKPGGRLCVDFYWKRLRILLHIKYLLRPITKRVPQAKLLKFLETVVPSLLKVSNSLNQVPFLGRWLKKLVPVANYSGIYALSEQQQSEWALLDTFDWFAPQYDNPQTKETLRSWCRMASLKNFEIFHFDHLVARGQK